MIRTTFLNISVLKPSNPQRPWNKKNQRVVDRYIEYTRANKELNFTQVTVQSVLECFNQINIVPDEYCPLFFYSYDHSSLDENN